MTDIPAAVPAGPHVDLDVDADRPTRFTSRFFIAGTGARSRRPIDVALAVMGLVTVLACARAAAHRGVLDSAVSGVSDYLPRWATTLFDAAYAIGAVYAVGVVIAVVLTAPRRGRLPFAVLLAVGAAVGGAVIASYFAGAGLPEIDPGRVQSGSAHGFPTLRVAVVTAVLLVLRPFVVSSVRRFHVGVVTVQCVAAWAIGIAGPTDVLGALAIGIAAAGVTLVVVGSPAGHPDVAQVADSLARMGVRVHGLRLADRQPWGARILYADSEQGRPLLIKVYGRDATDARLAARWWRTLIYRDQSSPGATRLQLVEHEALLTIMAERAGVRVDDLVAAAESSGDAVLVLGAPRTPLVDAPTLDDETVRRVWASVGELHAAGLTHGELTLEHVAADSDGPVLSEFSGGVVAATEAQRAQEIAVLLSSVALAIGPARAVDTALAGLGTDVVVAAQPYLQRAALPRSLRSSKETKATIESLKTTIAERTGTEPPPPAEIVRVRPRDLLQTGFILLAAYILLSTLLDLDWATVWSTWSNAAWAWVVVGLVICQTTSLADAGTALSTVRSRLPLVPLVHLQYAVKTVGLAISATLGRVALYTTFFRRYGEGPAVAVTATGLDSFAASVANVLVVLVAVLLAQSLPEGMQLSGPGNLDRILVLFVVVLVLSALAVVLVPKLRRQVVMMVRSLGRSLQVVTESPTRALGLFGTNLLSLMITALCLECLVQGMQPSISYGSALFVAASASLFASLVPVPGNVGVGEAAIAAGLVAVGVPAGPAFAIAVSQRMCTTYLPSLFGIFSLRWLRKEDFID
ncbi:lysylphosphatidylglycerol synthase domain-containing protein [Nocardioides sp. URHA0020]|uniref:lysylphosphatidylglycerol synthase domain-containing protein n=1 Tax=Nocardioides sp. URHA0020 TaxID=1380392 RepID=UPI00056798E0|nr:lysylphosphatidylglycerol synthase domain-containing protein [Nocardioides sp. URHA0020]